MDRKWKILLLISVGSFMAFLDAPVVSVAFPALQETFEDAGPSTLAWVLDAYFIGFAAFLLVAGKLADWAGRRRLFVAGLLIFTLASLVCAVAPSAGVLIAGRALQAVGAAIVVPAGQALMLAAFPPAERKMAIGALAAIVGLAVAAAPAIGGLITDGPGWRWIFYLNLFVGFAAIAYAMRLLDDDRPQTRPAQLPDGLGAVVQALGLGLLVYAILESADWGIADVRTLAAFAGGLALLAFFVARCARHPSPVLDLELFRSRTFTVANVASFALGLGLYAMALNSVLYFTNVWEWSVLAAGLAFIPGSLASAISGKPAGELAEKHGPRIVAVVGSFAAGAGLLLIAVSTGFDENYALDFVPGQVIYGVGVVAAMTALVGAALTSVPPQAFALASGVNSAARQVGGAIGTAIVIAITGTALGPAAVDEGQAGWAVAGGSLLLAGAISLLIRAVPQEQAVAEPAVPEPAAPAKAGAMNL